MCPPGVEVLETCPSGGARPNMIIYYRYDSGWAKGKVKRLVEHSDTRSLNGLYATVYDDGEFFNDLDPVNYGTKNHWVALLSLSSCSTTTAHANDSVVSNQV